MSTPVRAASATVVFGLLTFGTPLVDDAVVSRRLTRVARRIAALLAVVVAAMWIVAYLAVSPMPLWVVAILAVATLGCVREAYHLFRRICLYAESYQHARTQGASPLEAKTVATRYVDIRLPWGRRTPDALRVLREAETSAEADGQS